MTSKRLVSSMVAVTLVFLSGWVVIPTSSAAPAAPDWLPWQSARLSSSLTHVPMDYLTANWVVSSSPLGELGSPARQAAEAASHTRLQQAAMGGARIPGISDASRALGIPASQVTHAQAVEHFPGYDKVSGKPGYRSLVAAPANSRGVYTITSAQPPAGGASRPGVMAKGGKALGTVAKGAGVAALGFEAFNLGTSVGTGAAQLMGLSTTGSFTCDVATFFADSDCGLTGGPEYIVNSDALPYQLGWQGDNALEKAAGVLSGNVATSTQYGSKSYVIDLRIASTGVEPTNLNKTYPNTTYHGSGGYIEVFCRDTNGSGAPVDTPLSAAQPGAIGGGNGSYVINNGYSGFDVSATTSRSCASTGLYGVKLTSLASQVTQIQVQGGPGEILNQIPGKSVWWLPLGNPKRVDVEANPERRWRTDWVCSGGATGSALSPAFTEADEAWAPIPKADCGSKAVQSMKIWQKTVGLADLLMYDWTVPQGVADQNTDFPECSNGACVLDLITKKTGVEVSCFIQPELCVNWLTEVKDQNSTDYQCRFQGKDVAIAECYIYGPSFNRAKVNKGVVYGDPKTGLDPDVDPKTGPVVEDYDPNCPPPFSIGGLFSGWWVYQGAKCAIVETFVPNQGFVSSKIDSLRTNISARPPASIVVAGSAAAGAFTDGWSGGCSSLPDFDPARQGRLQLPCSPPGGMGFNALYTLATIVLAGGTILALWHMGAATMNAQATGE